MKIRRLGCLLLALCLLTGCGGSPETTTQTPEETQAVPQLSGDLNIYCFQAGKADAFLFWNEAGAVLLDTGESGFGKTIVEKLGELGIEKLDWLILTHFDKDHVGGAKKLLNEIPVDHILQSNCPKTGASAYDKYAQALTELGLEAVTLRERLSFTIGDTLFTVDPPAREGYPQDESNNSSLIVSVLHGTDRLLFCGDAEDLRLAEYLQNESGQYDLVKLPHHGVYQSTLVSLLDKTRPDWGVICSSEEEPEDSQTLELLESRGVKALLTREGPVTIRSSGSGLTVTQ